MRDIIQTREASFVLTFQFLFSISHTIHIYYDIDYFSSSWQTNQDEEI